MTKQDNNQAVKAHLTELKAFDNKFTKLSTDFSALVTNSVNLLWEHGQIAVINKTMDTLTHMKGADMRALATYYKQCVPYTFDGEVGRFTKKNKKQEEKLIETYADFIAENQWFEFSKVKEAKPYELNIDNLISLVKKRLEKGAENGDQVTNEKLEQLALGMNDVINEFVKVDINDDNTVEDITDDNLEKGVDTPDTPMEKAMNAKMDAEITELLQNKA